MKISRQIANTIVDPGAYQAGIPLDEAFTTIRRDTPFALAEADDHDPFWVVSTHNDLVEIERKPDLFRNGTRSSTILTREADAMVRKATNGDPNLVRSLVALDGQEHKDIRAVTFPSFSPQSIKKLEESIRGTARMFVDDMLARAPECDFASDIAFLYPLRVVMKVLGVPEEDEPLMLKLTQEVFSSNDPELNRTGEAVSPTEAMALLAMTMRDLETYFLEVTKRFRAQPAENINSLIANARIGGEYLNHRQLMGYYIIAATAGHDTTSNATAGSMWALAERPELLVRLREQPALIGAFLEESIRWVTPVKHFMRTASQDTEFRGEKIAEGDWLMLSYHSANRDETVFEDPFSFNIDRKPNKQIAFGYGPHVCLGQHLARLEMKILWEELLPRLSSIELAGPPQLTRSNFVCGPKSVPIRFTVQ